MSKTSKASIGVTVTGDGVDNSYVPPNNPLTNAAAPSGGPVKFVLAAGANTITLPAGAVGCVLTPPASSTNAKIIKGVAGDTGIGILASAAILLTFVAGTVSFDVDSVGIESLDLQWL